jgi:hypothetical protein
MEARSLLPVSPLDAELGRRACHGGNASLQAWLVHYFAPIPLKHMSNIWATIASSSMFP